MKKICNKCLVSKELNEENFHKRSDSLDGFRNDCKECISQNKKEYYLVNQEKLLIYRNLVQYKERTKQYHLDNKEKHNNQTKEYGLIHKERLNKLCLEYYYQNREKRLKYDKEYLIRIGKTNGKGISFGEQKIKKFLENKNIIFKREEDFNTHKFWFDFYLPDKNLIIEYDGEFHFLPIFGQEGLQKQQQRDILKNKFCQEQNIELLRIPYWDFNQIEQILISKIK